MAKDKKKKDKKKKRGTGDPGPSVKDAPLYEKLRREGNSKKKSARIANAAAGTSRPKVGTRGGSSPTYGDWTKSALYDRARTIGLQGRSSMSKQQLIDALRSS